MVTSIIALGLVGSRIALDDRSCAWRFNGRQSEVREGQKNAPHRPGEAAGLDPIDTRVASPYASNLHRSTFGVSDLCGLRV